MTTPGAPCARLSSRCECLWPLRWEQDRGGRHSRRKEQGLRRARLVERSDHERGQQPAEAEDAPAQALEVSREGRVRVRALRDGGVERTQPLPVLCLTLCIVHCAL